MCNQADTGDWVAESVVKGEKGRSFRLFFVELIGGRCRKSGRGQQTVSCDAWQQRSVASIKGKSRTEKEQKNIKIPK